MFYLLQSLPPFFKVENAITIEETKAQKSSITYMAFKLSWLSSPWVLPPHHTDRKKGKVNWNLQGTYYTADRCQVLSRSPGTGVQVGSPVESRGLGRNYNGPTVRIFSLCFHHNPPLRYDLPEEAAHFAPLVALAWEQWGSGVPHSHPPEGTNCWAEDNQNCAWEHFLSWVLVLKALAEVDSGDLAQVPWFLPLQKEDPRTSFTFY